MQTQADAVLPFSETLREDLAFYAVPARDERDLERNRLLERFSSKLRVNPNLTRQIVSYQASKSRPFLRWFKYKEAFSEELVHSFIDEFANPASSPRRLLDPFAGIGTALFAATQKGWASTGIELHPIPLRGAEAVQFASSVDPASFQASCSACIRFLESDSASGNNYHFPHLRITRGAFSKETDRALAAFEAFTSTVQDRNERELLRFACMCVLEDVSFTRKDGQYLRWDQRSERPKARLNKGVLPSFSTALKRKLSEIAEDISLAPPHFNGNPEIRLINESCLKALPTLPRNRFDLIVTSPPYVNRYDYTRTYALELAYCGYADPDVKHLRQSLLSSTVENKSKQSQMWDFYQRLGHLERLREADDAYNTQLALREVLVCLDDLRDKGELSNRNVPDLVRNYFYEMALVIRELSRVTKAGGKIIMVNDNVQYHGEEVPVDLILSSFAETFGLSVERIDILPRGKGNSSQQMGRFGRRELRKCVYVWRKE